MTENRRANSVAQLCLFPTSNSCDDIREKLGLVEQTLHLLGRAHAEALWADLGLPPPKATRSPRRSQPRPGPACENQLHIHMRRFVENCLDPDPLAEVRTEVVYRTYVDWAKQSGELVLTCAAMGKVLKAIGIKSRRSNNTIYCGVHLRPRSIKNPDPLSIFGQS